VLQSVDLDAMVEAWHRAITRPPAARFRVLVAVAAHQAGSAKAGAPGDPVVGFATTVPSADADAQTSDGEIEEFVVDPPAQGRGHGSRLLNACVDTMRADGFSRGRWWLDAVDDVLRAFAIAAGWAPDGAWREIGPSEDGPGGEESPEPRGIRIKQVRLHADIA
jgi:ribosomal protein S18 acetylase RimI-like enzyme